MDTFSELACDGVKGLRKAAQWTKQEFDTVRQRLHSPSEESRPRKRARTDSGDHGIKALASASAPRYASQPTQSSSTQTLQLELRAIAEATPAPEGPHRRQDLTFDTLKAPVQATDASVVFTGTTLAASELVAGPSATEAIASSSATAVTASPAASNKGMSTTTQAVVISCSIAGALILITLIVLLCICLRRRKRKAQDDVVHLAGVPSRMDSVSTFQSESSEPEKQALMHYQPRSRSVSPASRGPPSNTPQHGAQRSLGGYRPFMATIPESPRPGQQSPSPSSVYTKKFSPPQLGPGQLQLEELSAGSVYIPPRSPAMPPPLRIRQPADPSTHATLDSGSMISPKNKTAPSARIPFMSGFSSSGQRRGSTGTYASSHEGARGANNSRRTMDSETLPPPGMISNRYRDSFWSVAASSILKPRQSRYEESTFGSNEFFHTRSNSTSSSGHSRSTSLALGPGSQDDATMAPLPGRTRSHSSVHSHLSARRPSEALIPALPHMPPEFEEQRLGHKNGLHNQSVASTGSTMTLLPRDFELKPRLHSVDFWAKEEREMRLGTFAPAELEGSSSHAPKVKQEAGIAELPTPRDENGAVIGAAVGSRHSNPFFAPEEKSSYAAPGQGGTGPTRESAAMPQGYRHESGDDGRRLWNRGRSQDTSDTQGRSSASTVATVFKYHPGNAVMI